MITLYFIFKAHLAFGGPAPGAVIRLRRSLHLLFGLFREWIKAPYINPLIIEHL
jgi:hypothetical protein